MASFLVPTEYPVMLSPDLKHAWINIPKNCSSFVQKVLDDNGWNMLNGDVADSILATDSIKKIVVLREPTQRWVSGFAETHGYCNADETAHSRKVYVDKLLELFNNSTFWNIIYNNPVMCHHTEMQHRFIGTTKNVQYIKLQDKELNSNAVSDPNRFYKEFSSYIRYTGGTSNFEFWSELINPVTNDKNKIIIYNAILKVMKNSPDLEESLRLAHKQDYDLFNKLERFTV